MINLEGLRPWAGLPQAALEEASVVIAGIPYDGSAVYRRGAAQAPATLRRLSAAVPPVDERGRFLDDVTLHDLGDLDAGDDIERSWESVAGRLAAIPPEAFLTVLGGDHCSFIPVLAAQARRHPGLALLWVDAHPDLCDTSRGGTWTCGCALRRALECAALPASDIALVGCRDFDWEEVGYIEQNSLVMVSAAAAAEDPAGTVRRLRGLLDGRPVHISFDIDALDPAFAPGTEVACAGGFSTREALDLLAGVAAGSRLVGVDVCEVSPPLDHTDITSLAALKLIFELWSMRSRRGDR